MSQECRILYLVGQLRAGGLERQLVYLLRSMDRARYRPAVVVWNSDHEDFYLPEIRTLEIPLFFMPRGGGSSKLRAFSKLVRDLNPELVHSYSFYTNFAAWYATLGTHALPVGSVRSDFLRAKRDSGFYLGRLCARLPSTQIFNSLAAFERARKYTGPFVPSKVFVVRNGVDLKRFTRSPLPDVKRAKIIGIGSLIPVKRWDRLLRAAFRLKQEGFDFLVKIVGDGPLRRPLEEQANELGIAERFEFVNRSGDIPGLLAQASALVHTSESEGCPNVIMEAMACGRPVVATDAGDAPSLVEDGTTGFIVPGGDDEVLATRMATLMSSPALCARMGGAGRAKAEREFSLERLVSETFSAYRMAGWTPNHSQPDSR